ncbi:MAG: plasmid pRiA4b ORF-3 family protein [Rhodospirillales bacterium]|nr:plasmid pRiA4b ORF-3 family protein [Rhodospirillales bacterium]MCB9965197.1 plasmid pRiA4b ORF-3 family protein [Rhodospirillales bacterium]MCB9973216.1 plasmid pRiA4b ORF-3 family protein [Rhodospirillales bacterium]MCB9979524.1 plasmid pRiA4b ORF-3 family protein [Rhodospirillales bacterium]
MGAKEKQRTHFYYQIDKRLFTLDVKLTSGPMTETFCKANKKIVRRIEVRGDQTLAELHEAIYAAFDREEEHMFEFRLNEREYMDLDAKRYVLPFVMEDDWGDRDKPAGDVTTTTIGTLDLKEGDSFNYWFDFGDDWWHEIKIVSIADKAPEPEKSYPKITSRTGNSPPQYPDWDEMA